MKNIKKFTAAAAAIILAGTSAGCSAPGAITIGSSTKNALTVDGYDISAGVFIYQELMAYDEAASVLYNQNGTYPTADDVENATIDSVDSVDWIQDKATQYCREYVAVEREFDKIGGELTADELTQVGDAVDYAKDQAVFKDNGIGENSLRELYAHSFKEDKVFEHYFGVDSEYGSTEDELKEYFIDNTARLKYFTISLNDSDGNKLEGDDLRDLNNLIDDYVKEINSASTDSGKMKKFDEVKVKFDEYLEEKQAEEAAAAAAEAAEDGSTTTTTETTTTTTTTESGETTTTTTTSPYENEVTLTKYTTTTAPVGEVAVVTSEPQEETEAQKASRLFNEKVFSGLENYKAERYDYDDTTVYIVIKGDIKERMTDDDLWTEDILQNTIGKKYSQDYKDMIKSLGDSYSVSKNKKAYRRYDPFDKIDVEAK